MVPRRPTRPSPAKRARRLQGGLIAGIARELTTPLKKEEDPQGPVGMAEGSLDDSASVSLRADVYRHIVLAPYRAS